MKNLLLTPLFKLFKKSTFLLSLNQNSCPVLDAEDIKKQEQKERKKLLKGCTRNLLTEMYQIIYTMQHGPKYTPMTPITSLNRDFDG